MAGATTRRGFLGATLAGGLAGLEARQLLAALPTVPLASLEPRPGVVPLRPEIEPLVRLLEETPRERLLEEIAQRIRDGLNYQQLLAALLLAGVRNVQPRPSVGFKFHAVLVVYSAHLASLASPAADRWLPIFWTLDYFKSAQARDVQEGNWTMPPVDESALPSPSQARDAFERAMQDWDEQAADTAVAALARSAGAQQIFELFCRFGCRDFRSIGHKAIFVSQARRTLDCIGWQHAEPVLRSLAYALLNHHGERNPSESDHAADRPGRRNAERLRKIRDAWLDGQTDDGATQEMMSVLREDSADAACDAAVGLLNRGIAPQSLWDAIFCSAGELSMRQPGIVALHAATTSNALHYAFTTCGRDETRKLLLLQNIAFLPLFREAMRGRGEVENRELDKLEPQSLPPAQDAALADIFVDVSRDQLAAAGKTLAYLQEDNPASPLIDEARRLIFLKGTDSHDYKFSSAVLEDYHHISRGWRDRYLAASVFQLRGSEARDNELVQRIRSALNA